MEIEAKEARSYRLLDALESGTLDLAILSGQSNRPAIRSLCFWSEPLMVGLAPGHPLIGREPLYWSDLRGAAFVVTAADPGPDLAAMIIARLSGPGHRPSITVQDVSRENLLSFATASRVVVSGVSDFDCPAMRTCRSCASSMTLSAARRLIRESTDAPTTTIPRSRASWKCLQIVMPVHFPKPETGRTEWRRTDAGRVRRTKRRRAVTTRAA